MRTVEPAFVNILVTAFAILIIHQRTLWNELVIRRSNQGRAKVILSFIRAHASPVLWLLQLEDNQSEDNDTNANCQS